MSGRLSLLLVVVMTALPAVGCTKSHDLERRGPRGGDGEDVDASVDEGNDPAGRGGRGGSGGTGGTGGTGGGMAAAGRGGSAGAPSCGNCPPPEGLLGLLAAQSCCTASRKCGLTAPGAGIVDCLEMNAPGAEDESCPAVTIGGIFPLPGCCGEDGVCGALDTFIGLGCARFSAGEEVRCTP